MGKGRVVFKIFKRQGGFLPPKVKKNKGIYSEKKKTKLGGNLIAGGGRFSWAWVFFAFFFAIMDIQFFNKNPGNHSNKPKILIFPLKAI